MPGCSATLPHKGPSRARLHHAEPRWSRGLASSKQHAPPAATTRGGTHGRRALLGPGVADLSRLHDVAHQPQSGSGAEDLRRDEPGAPVQLIVLVIKDNTINTRTRPPMTSARRRSGRSSRRTEIASLSVCVVLPHRWRGFAARIIARWKSLEYWDTNLGSTRVLRIV